MAIPCKVCDQGELKKRRVYRMNGVVAFIGYIFLIPSLLGILFGVLGMAGTAKTVSELPTSVSEKSVADLHAAAVPENIITEISDGKRPTKAETDALTAPQQAAVHTALSRRDGAGLGTGAAAVVGGGLSIMLIIVSLCGGLLGWLLTMKKSVLKCTSCGAVVAAS